jgi:hypothetical protein
MALVICLSGVWLMARSIATLMTVKVAINPYIFIQFVGHYVLYTITYGLYSGPFLHGSLYGLKQISYSYVILK